MTPLPLKPADPPAVQAPAAMPIPAAGAVGFVARLAAEALAMAAVFALIGAAFWVLA